MRILDKYILKSFFRPFIATLLIVLFVLVMQMLWQAFENIAGKGISIVFILKYLYYTTLIMLPQALPIAILLSSIMTLGNLGENYEFAAAKSAGVSLQRLVRPLVVLVLLLSFVNFFFVNNVYPYAILNQSNLYLNIKKKKPALALVEGSFNSDLPGYQIKFEEKYGEDKNLLKNVLIYDLTGNRGNQKVITAEKGKIITEEGSRYMTFILNNGNYYEEHVKNAKTVNKRKKMAASSATFDEYEFNIDISSIIGSDLDSNKITKHFRMLTLKQLKDTVPHLKERYDEILLNRSNNIYTSVFAKELYKYPDSLKSKKIDSLPLSNFEDKEKIGILNSAITKTSRALSSLNNNTQSIKWNRKTLNHFDTEYYNRIAFYSLACLVLFFIGAPLGSIIRKGGFGLPMVLAISVYVTYFFTNTFGRNLAEESSITAFLGSWISFFIMAPLAILLTIRATKDKGIFNVDAFLQPITKIFKKINPFKKKAL